MFHYLHCYMPETWDAQVKAGLVNENGGIRFCESIDIKEELKFNNLAKKGGTLYNIVKERKCSFYIDRLQGGCYYEGYPYDMELVNEYKHMLGDNFFGFQMHEWMSNYNSDLEKIRRNNCKAFTPTEIEAAIRREFKFGHLFVESMDVNELAEKGNPATAEEFAAVAKWLFEKRMRYTDGMLVPCDSFYLSYPIELRAGAKRLMPEIGNQTPNTRIQVAYARGMTKAKKLTFGTYYEPWGGSPFSACCYHKDGLNEWNIGGDNFPFETCGSNGGSSRSLQRRMHLYSYMAGASFMAEEWGMCNTFIDWQDFELSEYGLVKRDFIRFTEKYANIGSAITPIAVVLPKELDALEGVSSEFGSFVYGRPAQSNLTQKAEIARRGLEKLFCTTAPMLGTECHNLLNCTIPDALDIVQEDFINTDDYEYLVDLTGNNAFGKKYAGKICSPEDVAGLLNKLLPCRVEGSCMKQFTKADDGTVYVMLLNNSGVERSVEKGEILLSEADSSVTLTPKDGKVFTKLEGNGDICCENGVYKTVIPAGGWLFGKLG